MTKFFKGITTFRELKDTYRKLARELHPDIEGGNAELFKAMKEEYDRLFQKMKDGKFDTEAERKTHTNVSFDYQTVIDKLIFVDGAEIEMIGNWIWVWGIKAKEKEKHAVLKSLGMVYSKSKNGWYLKGTESKWRKNMTKDEMRNVFGSTIIGKGGKPLLEE